ncbi:hypothetical protein D3C72_1475370 [compost metagenome]
MPCQQHRPRQQRQCGQHQQLPAAQPVEAPPHPLAGRRAPQRQRQRDQRRVEEQVGQVPEVVPGDAELRPRERALGPRRAHRQVAQQEGAEARRHQPAGHALGVGLVGHDHRHAKGQRQHQPQAPAAQQAPGALTPAQETERHARDQEHQVHAPQVQHPHRPRQPLGRVRALQVPGPVGHVVHAHVVEDDEQEGEGAQGVDVVAALRCEG